MPSPRIRVALVDDHAMVRQALASFLEDDAGIEITGQASSRGEAVALVRATDPDVVVLDYNIPGGGALKVIEAAAAESWRARILVLTVHDSSHYAVQVLEAGAHGFLVKSSAIEELCAAIDQVHRGRVYITPSLVSEVFAHMRQPRRRRLGLAALSERELELVRNLASGLTLSEAADAQGVSISTASTYRARALEKLNLRTTAALIRFALENDLVP